MDNNQDMRVENRRPSEVFLRLWRWHATSCGDATAADFELCAEAWAEIRRMETKEAAENTAGRASPAPTERTDSAPEPVSDSDTEADTSSTASGPPSPQGEGNPGRDAAEIARKGFATRKQKAAEALDQLRAAGVALADIAAAAKGLTISEVMDALERKNLALPVWAKIEKAVAKLNAQREDADGQEG